MFSIFLYLEKFKRNKMRKLLLGVVILFSALSCSSNEEDAMNIPQEENLKSFTFTSNEKRVTLFTNNVDAEKGSGLTIGVEKTIITKTIFVYNKEKGTITTEVDGAVFVQDVLKTDLINIWTKYGHYKFLGNPNGGESLNYVEGSSSTIYIGSR
jgi:lipopolysaccharide export system protein LptA